MKTLLALLLFAVGAFAADPPTPTFVNVTITVTTSGVTKTYSVDLTAATRAALVKKMVEDSSAGDPDNQVGTMVYDDEGDLLIKHVVKTLTIPAVQKYQTDSAVQTALAAQTSAKVIADAAVFSAATGTVTVH